MDVNDLRKLLHEGIVRVKFKKVNGDERLMTCTLNPELIPESAKPKGGPTISEEKRDSTLRVYDVSAKGWRSFIVENVITVYVPSYDEKLLDVVEDKLPPEVLTEKEMIDLQERVLSAIAEKKNAVPPSSTTQ